ncbi:MAG: hypothetical protein LBQ34_03815 [Alphaproteobacteria bacterium]|jgi:hypothetical protein|nr:hypothetical protein [Alphaproteobacteria bacterium]
MKNVFKLLAVIVVFFGFQVNSLFAICDKAYNENLPANYEWYVVSDNRTAQQLFSATVTNAIQFCRTDGRTITMTIDNMRDGATLIGVIDNRDDTKTTLTIGRDNVQTLLRGEDPRVGFYDSIKLFVESNRLYMGFLVLPPSESALQPIQ